MARRLVVAFALLLVLLVVEPAYASPIDGFANGLNDFVNPDSPQEVVTPERDFIEGYSPDVYGSTNESVREVSAELSSSESVSATVDSIYTVNWFGNGTRTWLESLQIFLLNSTFFKPVLVAAVGLAFMWWGVRKAIRMIMTSFRKGRMTT